MMYFVHMAHIVSGLCCSAQSLWLQVFLMAHIPLQLMLKICQGGLQYLKMIEALFS